MTTLLLITAIVVYLTLFVLVETFNKSKKRTNKAKLITNFILILTSIGLTIGIKNIMEPGVVITRWEEAAYLPLSPGPRAIMMIIVDALSTVASAMYITAALGITFWTISDPEIRLMIDIMLESTISNPEIRLIIGITLGPILGLISWAILGSIPWAILELTLGAALTSVIGLSKIRAPFPRH